ncbi:HAD family hydrolase [Streptoverticillium reticulum]|uniref:HAD family hydrolase n=1 Tax=Streptoverticillium reticulum TaxID=1433415 RepID=UPI0039BEDA99
MQHAAELRERGHALPGAAAALDAMATVPGVAQTVVTGNVRPVAETKLGAFGLDRHIQWELGAYGEDADERAELVRIALRRSGIGPANAVLVDDAPAGVAAGIANRVKVIAVATGRSSATELAQAGAHFVLADLSNTAAVVSVLSASHPEGPPPVTQTSIPGPQG